MSSWKVFNSVYLITFIVVFIMTIFLDNILNSSLKEYDMFIGDVLNFTSILTGFLGVMLGILTAVSKDSLIMNAIMNRRHIKKQLIVNIIIPFICGSINIITSISYRLILNNMENAYIIDTLNFIFILTVVYFCVTSILMSVIVFAIFFKNDEKKKVVDVE